jgi:hypothetical protein
MDKRTRVREAFLSERNIEPVARALCAKELGAVRSVSADDVPGLVDRLWPAVAAQLPPACGTMPGTRFPIPWRSDSWPGRIGSIVAPQLGENVTTA